MKRAIFIVAGMLLLVLAGWLGWNSWRSTRELESTPPETLGQQLAEIAPEVAAVDPDDAPSDPLGTDLGEIAPDFTVPTLEGGTFRLAEQRGKPTIIFFMAYWCGSCIPEGRELAKLQQEYGDRVSIIALDIDPTSTPEALGQFKKAADDGAFAWAFDAGQQVTNAYQVLALDTTLVLDPDGRVIYRDAFPTHYDFFKEALAGIGL